jgi:dihydroneopterin aldolase
VNKSPFPPSAIRLTSAKVFVRGLTVEAQIGVYEHEHGRRQPLLIEAELDVTPHAFEHIGDTINYETVVARAREIAQDGHVKLVEAFAEALARALMRDPRVLAARIRVDKPEALAPAIAGVEIQLSRV